MAVKSEGGRRNININPRDEDLIRTRDTIQDMVNLLQGRGPGASQTPGFSVAPPYKPARSVSDMMNPEVIYPRSQSLPPTPRMPQSRDDPVARIMQELQQMMGGSSRRLPQFQPIEMPQFDPNRFKKLATQSVSEQFDPIINEIMAQRGQTQRRAGANRQEVGRMYGSLAQSVNQDAVATGRQFDATQAESKKLYEDERNRIAAGYAADAASQRAAAKRLGIEALGVEQEIGQQNASKNFADQMNSQQMQSSQTALGQQEVAAADYDRAIANATRAEGAEAQRDIMGQLEEYMSQSNTNLAETRSQKAGSIQDLMMKLADAAYQRDAANTQFGYQQQRDYIGDQNQLFDRELDMKMAQLKAAQDLASLQGGGQGQGQEKLNPWQQVATFAESLRPGQGSQIVSAIQGAMFERPEIFARKREDEPMNPALFAKLIAQSQSAGNMDRNTLMMVSQELYRLLYGV